MSDLKYLLAQPGTVLLDTSSGTADSYLFHGPKEVYAAVRPSEVVGLLENVDRALAGGYHVAGYLGYEAGYGFESERFHDVVDVDYSDQLGYPIAWFGVYEKSDRIAAADLSATVFKMNGGSDSTIELALAESAVEYRSKVDQIRTLIRDGDVYQVNLTGRFKSRTTLDPVAVYSLMRSRQPVSYGAFIQLGEVQLLSASPERFIEWEEGQIHAQPMKGTAPRGATHELDDMLAVWLGTDPKNQAENVMIVDLLRNDFSVVCTPGTVKVPDLFSIDRYASLLQMTSTIRGSLRKSIKTSQILSALFPSGSITGAPKIRAMRRILELESTPRGIYCGAIGHLRPDGSGAFNVAIRTLSYAAGAMTLGAGGGIVWDSDSASEHEEAVLKTRFLSADRGLGPQPIEIIETMKWATGFELLAEHMARLHETAARLGYEVPAGKISQELEELEESFASGQQYVVRLLLGPEGKYRVVVDDYAVAVQGPYKIGISRRPVNSSNPFLQVKTTFRGIYEFGRREAEERGLDEVIFLNERGEITEGTITNIFLKLDGEWFTPPQSCGLLAGLGRQLELDSDRVPKEKVLGLPEYLAAEEIVLTNAVRGRLQAQREEG